MAETKKIVAWSECEIKVGAAGTTTSNLSSIGVIKDKSAVMTTTAGNVLELKSTGGHTVAYEQQEGTVTITCRVIEPGTEFYKSMFGLCKPGDTVEEMHIQTLTVNEEKCVEIIPKNYGAYGLFAPFCSVSIQTGWNEDEGNYADVTFGVLCKVPSGDADFYYKLKVKKKASSAS